MNSSFCKRADEEHASVSCFSACKRCRQLEDTTASQNFGISSSVDGLSKALSTENGSAESYGSSFKSSAPATASTFSVTLSSLLPSDVDVVVFFVLISFCNEIKNLVAFIEPLSFPSAVSLANDASTSPFIVFDNLSFIFSITT